MTRRPTPIPDLNLASSLASGDQIPISQGSSGDTRRVPISALVAFIVANALPPTAFFEQPSAPSASPFTVTITPIPTTAWTWLILTPTGTMAVGTINLPPLGSAVDGQEVLVNTTQAVTSLTVSATGLNVVGAPTTLAANAAFRMKFYSTTNTWYRISS